MLVNCIKTSKEFDTTHANDKAYNDKARSKCKDIMMWLYLVSKNSPSIDAIQITGCANEKVAIELNAKAKHCLSSRQDTETTISSQVKKSLKRPFKVLATSASSTSDFMEKLTQLQNQSSDKSSKSFKKIPVKYQNKPASVKLH